MADHIKLAHSGHVSSTSVPNDFIDRFMPSANGEYVKLYLYLLRCISSGMGDLSISAIADTFEHTENDVNRALSYWAKVNLLALEYDDSRNITKISLLDLPEATPTAVPVPTPEQTPLRDASQEYAREPASTYAGDPLRNYAGEPASAYAGEPLKGYAAEPASAYIVEPLREHARETDDEYAAEPSKKAAKKYEKEYSADQIKEMQKNDDLKQLLFIAEQYLNKTLTSMEISTILYFHEELGFATELIEYLIEYCVSKNHRSIRYIEKVALGWKDDGITTVRQAKSLSGAYTKSYTAVMKAFGISGRVLTEIEAGYVDRWTKELAFELDLITEACNRTILATHKPSFEYADSILTSWRQQNVTQRTDLIPLDEQHKKSRSVAQRGKYKAGTITANKFNNFTQRTYDYDALEKELLKTIK